MPRKSQRCAEEDFWGEEGENETRKWTCFPWKKFPFFLNRVPRLDALREEIQRFDHRNLPKFTEIYFPTDRRKANLTSFSTTAIGRF